MKKEIMIFPSASAIAGFLGRSLAAKTRDLAPGRYFYVALSGGKTPEAVLTTLAGHSGINRDRVRIFWGDERCVRPSSQQSDYRSARLSLLSSCGIPRGNIFRLRGEAPPCAEAARYSRLVRSLIPSAGTPRVSV